MLQMEVSKCWKIVEFTKISIKMHNCKTFCETQKTSRLNKIIQPPPNPPPPPPSDKILLSFHLRIYTEINGHLLSKCFKNAVLGVKKLWSANVFSNTMSSESKFIKWVRFFERNCIVKWVIIFGSFCWLWDFLLKNLKLKKNSDDVHWNVWTNIKKFYARKVLCRKDNVYELPYEFPNDVRLRNLGN